MMKQSVSGGRRILHRAALVIPGYAPPFHDGAVLTENGTILSVAPFSELRGQGVLFDHGDAILAPALINCHSHLELSHLGTMGSQGSFADITEWIRDLITRRQGAEYDFTAARKAIDSFVAQGVAIIADIGNLRQSSLINERDDIDVFFLFELLGLSRKATEIVMDDLADAGLSCTAHAPYSTSLILLEEIKRKAREKNSLFSIHVAESETELLFLRNGQGPLRRFVEEKGVWDGSFVPPACGAVQYLDDLGVLDDRTMCVHCVHISEDEIKTLVKRGAHVCLCPASNRYLRVGTAPVGKMLEAGLQPCLGTDSAASNPLLSMWEEMKILRQDHPSLRSDAVFSMATKAGARALGAGQYGEISKGKTSRFLVIERNGVSGKNVFDYLTSIGRDISLKWSEERCVS